jgi:hypothetical protein
MYVYSPPAAVYPLCHWWPARFCCFAPSKQNRSYAHRPAHAKTPRRTKQTQRSLCATHKDEAENREGKKKKGKKKKGK